MGSLGVVGRCYSPLEIEKKWQEVWQKRDLYKTPDRSGKKKYYCLVMFPYSSGDLHIGHWYNFAPADVFARYKRMRGYNVLHPMGFDSFGLPAEGAAIKRGIHPLDWTEKNAAAMVRQLKTIGAGYDWSRVLYTHRPDYYRWTQWLFLLMLKRDLAYKKKAPANWCPKCQSILANEQAEGGRCWRCEGVVEQREVEQWFFRITRYAEELLSGLGELDWPQRTLTMQKNWIGKSEGITIDYPVVGKEEVVACYSTRPETNFGAAFVVMAPEHPRVLSLTTADNLGMVKKYIERARRKTELERIGLEKEKTGVFTGRFCLNRLTGKKMPLWVADFVLATAGTGAVVGVPAHDQRDWQFAKKYALEIAPVVKPKRGRWDFEKGAYTALDGSVVFNSGFLNGLPPLKAKEKIIGYLVAKGWGRKAVNYHLRDWLVSRQRFWGAPIPLVHCPRCGAVPVPEEDLPVLLPEIDDFTPKEGESPLARSEKFVKTFCPRCGRAARRDTNTMDTFVCSSWYYLAYAFWSRLGRQKLKAGENVFVKYKDLIAGWLPVDRYIGGAEHTVLHLLYSRFFVKVLRDAGLLHFSEPFASLRHQGIILGGDHFKMSKSRGNVVNPDDLVRAYGADAVRLYLCFLGPYERGGPWNPRGIEGAARFLRKVWKLFYRKAAGRPSSKKSEKETVVEKRLQRLVKKVGEDIERMKFNTAVAAMMEFVKFVAGRRRGLTARQRETFLKLLAPFAPHLAEELWQGLAGTRKGAGANRQWSVHQQSWPSFDTELVREKTVTIAVQVDGKLRGCLSLSADGADFGSEDKKKRAAEKALSLPRIKKYTAGGVRRTVFIPGKLINFVT